MNRRHAVTILPFPPRAGAGCSPPRASPSSGASRNAASRSGHSNSVMHVALGRQYRGRRVRMGPVVYCALEGARGFKRRVAAFRKEKVQANRRTPT